MEEKHELRVRGLFVPLELFDDAKLSYFEKFLVITVDMLDNDARHCYASTPYLARRLNKSESSVENALTRLRKANWIQDVITAERRSLTTPLRKHREHLEALRDYPLKIENEPSQNREDHPLKIEKDPFIGLESGDELEEREKNNPLFTYLKFFPDIRPSLFQQDSIITSVTDLVTWEETCRFWANNNYQGRHVAGLLEKYQRDSESKSKPKLSATTVVVDDACPLCVNGTCPIHPGGNNGGR